MNNRPLVSPYGVGTHRNSACSARAGWTRWVAMAGALLALTMLAAFYSVVNGGVQRAAAKQEQLRIAAERQAACSASSSPSSRDLCLATVATPSNAMTSVSLELPTAAPVRSMSSTRYH